MKTKTTAAESASCKTCLVSTRQKNVVVHIIYVPRVLFVSYNERHFDNPTARSESRGVAEAAILYKIVYDTFIKSTIYQLTCKVNSMNQKQLCPEQSYS